MLGGERTLQLLTEPLAAVGAQVASGGAFDWATAEAALYCVRATHRCPLSYLCNKLNPMCFDLWSKSTVPCGNQMPLLCVDVGVLGPRFLRQDYELLMCCERSNAPEAGNALLLQLFGSLPQLPAVPQLQYTGAMLVAAYADWLAKTAAAGGTADLMPQLLQMLTTGVPHLAAVAVPRATHALLELGFVS